MSRIYLIRHGQASYGTDNYDRLSPLGIRQSEKLGNYLAKNNVKFDNIFTGPLLRQRDTMKHFIKQYKAAGNHIPKSSILEELKEHLGPNALKSYMPTLIREDKQVQEWINQAKINPSIQRKMSLRVFEMGSK